MSSQHWSVDASPPFTRPLPTFWTWCSQVHLYIPKMITCQSYLCNLLSVQTLFHFLDLTEVTVTLVPYSLSMLVCKCLGIGFLLCCAPVVWHWYWHVSWCLQILPYGNSGFHLLSPNQHMFKTDPLQILNLLPLMCLPSVFPIISSTKQILCLLPFYGSQ